MVAKNRVSWIYIQPPARAAISSVASASHRRSRGTIQLIFALYGQFAARLHEEAGRLYPVWFVSLGMPPSRRQRGRRLVAPRNLEEEDPNSNLLEFEGRPWIRTATLSSSTESPAVELQPSQVLAAAFLGVRVLGRNDARHDGGRRAMRRGLLEEGPGMKASGDLTF